MSELVDNKPTRKVLSLKLAPQSQPNASQQPAQFLQDDLCVYMVWREGGDMPKRVYAADERHRAISHAKTLSSETGYRFYVLRSWRGFDAE